MYKLNILVAGKSGVGKSSLLNYIIGNKILFETGEGSPVTQDYFNKEIFKSNNIEYHLFDTKGLEPDTTEEFTEELTSQIYNFKENPDVFEHIHTLYYCFGANNKRIEPFEISFIKKMMDQLDVVIVLTKSDLVNEEIKIDLKNELTKIFGEDIKIINICSVSKKLRIGEVKPFGKKQFLQHAFMGLWNTFSKHIPNLSENVFFSKEVALDFNNYHVKNAWYKHFDSQNFPVHKKHKIYLNNFMYFNIYGFIDNFFQKFSDKKLIKFILSYLKNSESLLFGEIETEHIFNNIIKNCNLTYCKIHEFYSELTGQNIPYKPLLLTEKKLKELSFKLSHEISLQIKKLNKNFIVKFTEVDQNPSWFGGDEERLAEDFIENYITEISYIYNDLIDEIYNIEVIYNTELFQFGNILIKDSFNEKIEITLNSINHISDLSNNQKIYYNKLRKIYEERIDIDLILRDKLDFLRESLGIIPQDAGLIEDFSRRL